ncbi:Dihydroorotase [compost metagenome]
MLQRLSSGPAQALRLPAGQLKVGGAADLVLFDATASTVAGEQWRSKGDNCPFIGHCLPGAVRYTLVDGHISHEA